MADSTATRVMTAATIADAMMNIADVMTAIAAVDRHIRGRHLHNRMMDRHSRRSIAMIAADHRHELRKHRRDRGRLPPDTTVWPAIHRDRTAIHRHITATNEAPHGQT
jgi:hypothetical protein